MSGYIVVCHRIFASQMTNEGTILKWIAHVQKWNWEHSILPFLMKFSDSKITHKRLNNVDIRCLKHTRKKCWIISQNPLTFSQLENSQWGHGAIHWTRTVIFNTGSKWQIGDRRSRYLADLVYLRDRIEDSYLAASSLLGSSFLTTLESFFWEARDDEEERLLFRWCWFRFWLWLPRLR